jgi:hypothetical protein
MILKKKKRLKEENLFEYLKEKLKEKINANEENKKD